MKFPKHPAHQHTPRRPTPPALHIPRAELHQLLAGRKTQHRLRIAGRVVVNEPPFTTGASVAVIPNGPSPCRVTIGEQTTEYLGRITLDDARAEGHKTRADFARAWISRTSGWANRFPVPSDVEVLAHFDRHYAAQLVWVVRFRLDREDRAPIMLTPAARPAGSLYGYTQRPDRALPGEPETMERDVFTDRGEVSSRMLKPSGDPDLDERRREQHLRRELDALLRRGRKEILATGRAGVDTTEELEALKRLIESVRLRRRDAA